VTWHNIQWRETFCGLTATCKPSNLQDNAQRRTVSLRHTSCLGTAVATTTSTRRCRMVAGLKCQTVTVVLQLVPRQHWAARHATTWTSAQCRRGQTPTIFTLNPPRGNQRAKHPKISNSYLKVGIFNQHLTISWKRYKLRT